MVKRRTWGARGNPAHDFTPKTEIFLHHSAFNGTAIDTFAEQCAAMRQMDAQHLGQGWPGGIGYCIVGFKPYGKLRRVRFFIGRGPDNVPAAQLDHNSGTIPICLVGNFEHEKVGWRMRRKLKRVIRRLKDEHPTLRRLRPHNAVTATACPGDNIERIIPELRKATGLSA